MITKLIVWSSIAIQKVMSGTEKFFQYPTLLFVYYSVIVMSLYSFEPTPIAAA